MPIKKVLLSPTRWCCMVEFHLWVSASPTRQSHYDLVQVKVEMIKVKRLQAA